MAVVTLFCVTTEATVGVRYGDSADMRQAAVVVCTTRLAC
jgi:hypothetical protein